MARKIGLLASMALLAAGLSAAQSKGRMVSFGSAPETVSGYLAAPEGGGKKPGLVIIQEWWGLDDFVKGKADHFARLGYVALAPDLYRGKVASDSDTAHQLMMGLDPERALRDLRAAVASLAARPDVDPSKIGSVGWCMGGAYSLRLALAEPRLVAAAIYYGRLVTDEKQIGALRAPLLGNFGGKDQGPDPESVREFERKAKAAGRSVDFKIYPDAGHGFASSKEPNVFRAEDARDADRRTEEFFERVLKRPQPRARSTS